MSVTVSYLRSNSTQEGGWGGHTHELSVTDHEVVEASELVPIAQDLKRCLRKLAQLDATISAVKEKVESFDDLINTCTDTSVLIDAFKSVVSKNLQKIQKENDKVSAAISRLEDAGLLSHEN